MDAATANNGQTENGSPREGNRTPVLKRILKRGRRALEMLHEAVIYAADVNRSTWDFSLELDVLTKGGLTLSDLRWLMCNGYLEQAREVDAGGAMTRKFDPADSLTFTGASCFILTETGKSFVHEILSGEITPREASSGVPTTSAEQSSPQQGTKPCWDRDRQELSVGVEVVKRFRVPAPNQEVILAAFQEEDWPECIEDPLPPRPDSEPKHRLQETLNLLNQNQRAELLRFFEVRDRGVCWEFIRQ